MCDFCTSGEVEDEKHFMLYCPLYRKLREDLWSKCTEEVLLLPLEDRFVPLLSSESQTLTKAVLSFIKQAMKIRRKVEKEREQEEEEKKRKTSKRRRID